MFALSTAWNASRLQDGEQLTQEILSLGARAIELNFSLDERMVDQIASCARKNHICITSLHNFCPTPPHLARLEALPDCYSLSSLDENERKQAVFYTKKTISCAKKLGAKAVVLHSGRVEIEDKTRLLIGFALQGKAQSQEYKDVLEGFIRERRLKSPDAFNQVLKSYEELSPFAESENILLGVENRFYYREIPSFEEFGEFFAHFKNKNIAYWHDVGHAFILERLGFMPPMALLKNYSTRLCGIHLHNIKDLADHQAPQEGDFDLALLKPYLSKDTIKVIEVHRHVPEHAVKESFGFLQELFHES